ncbi:protein kinase domain protein [Ichthyophthirius multifiliis]|uniref:Protein kinase domain protein n=1 Tax=Ichthyophthirius multifiliis TaxID=5932 RepID=G0QNV4_ICHMU|nr:protein kinase domain protein [Ichthyophthirius multifiliis]EGR33108.1 protein kinase domain protein [Ichthyophthirius multifiliis]|eukprot:XP_004037094.1 protein kinase domain protein [Ichthyophthirius multifiliis]
MEIVEGISLYDDIKKHAQQHYQEQEIREIMRMLIDGVCYCNNKNIMHRDIKPENLLFGKKGNQNVLKIVDFGLATYADEIPYIFPKCGTPGFVAPEIANLIDKAQEKDPLKRTNAQQALLHSYFTQAHGIVRANSSDNITRMSLEDLENIPNIREKQQSMFTKPPRIPYLTREQGDTEDNLNSFLKEKLENQYRKNMMKKMKTKNNVRNNKKYINYNNKAKI